MHSPRNTVRALWEFYVLEKQSYVRLMLVSSESKLSNIFHGRSARAMQKQCCDLCSLWMYTRGARKLYRVHVHISSMHVFQTRFVKIRV